MAGFLGADTDALRTFAERATTGGDRLGELCETLTSTVGAVEWVGPDAEAFRSDFTSRAVSAFTAAQDALGARGQEADAHAEEQDRTSEGDDASGGDGASKGEGGVWDPLSGGLADNPLTHVLETIKAAATAGGKVWGAFKQMRSLADLARAIDVGGDAAMSAQAFIRSGMIDDAAGFLGKLGTVGKIGGGALGVLGIVSGVQSMIDPEHDGWRGVGDRIAGGLSVVGGAGGLAVALGAGAMLGPVGLGVVAVAGAGAALWTLGNAVYDNWDSITEFAGNAVDTVKDFGSDVVDTVGDVVGGVSDFVGGLFS